MRQAVAIDLDIVAGLNAQGKNDYEIAKVLGVSRGVVRNARQKLGLPCPERPRLPPPGTLCTHCHVAGDDGMRNHTVGPLCRACYQYHQDQGILPPKRVLENRHRRAAGIVVACDCGQPATRIFQSNGHALMLCEDCWQLEMS